MALSAMRGAAAADRRVSPLTRLRLDRLDLWTMNENQKRMMVQGFEKARAKGLNVGRARRGSARGG